MIEQQIDGYLDQRDEDYKLLAEELEWEWAKKPALIKAILKIRSFVRDIIYDIKDRLSPVEDPPF